MAYVGRGIDNISNASLLDVITFTGSAGPYNLTKSSAAFTPVSVQALVISIDGIIQAPSSYTISAATITFDSVMASTSTNDFIVHNGVGLITEPSDGSVTTAKIDDLAVTTAKLANTNVTAGKLATDAVETAKIKDLNVTAGKLAATQDLSTKTITLPASVSGLGTGITNSQLAGSIDVTTKITGVVPTANLGSGSASSSTYLAGDQTYKAIVAVDIAWQAVTTGATLSATAGNGYPIDTTSNACTVTLPASASVGDQIIFTDYARNWNTNALTIDQNSLKFQGGATPNPVYDTDGESIHIVYMDVTKGWVPLYDGAVAFETPQTYTIEWLVISGGGSGGAGYRSGGGGAGGYKNSYASETSGGNSATETPWTNQGAGDGDITVTVGDGGVIPSTTTSGINGVIGGASSIAAAGESTVSCYGGGGGGIYSIGNAPAGTYGSGGGAADIGGTASYGTDGTVDEGENGGDTTTTSKSQGACGGGASDDGDDGSTDVVTYGGEGLSSSITGSAVLRAGGGGCGSYSAQPTVSLGADGGGNGGLGSGGPPTTYPAASDDNKGGGGGGYSSPYSTPNIPKGSGGSGVVILRMPTVSYSGTTSGSPTVTTDGDYTILQFNDDGTYTR